MKNKYTAVLIIFALIINIFTPRIVFAVENSDIVNTAVKCQADAIFSSMSFMTYKIISNIIVKDFLNNQQPAKDKKEKKNTNPASDFGITDLGINKFEKKLAFYACSDTANTAEVQGIKATVVRFQFYNLRFIKPIFSVLMMYVFYPNPRGAIVDAYLNGKVCAVKTPGFAL
jgi:hypothetical protein